MTNTNEIVAALSPAQLRVQIDAMIAMAQSAKLGARVVPVYGGCARIYVRIATADRRVRNAIAASCKAQGLLYLDASKGPYAHSIYIGYDNATGREYAQGEAFAAVLNAHGISAYVDGVGD